MFFVFRDSVGVKFCRSRVEVWGLIDGGILEIILTVCWNVFGGLWSRFFLMFFSIVSVVC